jgi:hypothetical protein
MTAGTQIDSVRAFVRNLNVVVKQVNLYGFAHKQVAPQLESTWKELEHCLTHDKLVLTAAGDHLLLNGKPLQAGSADKNFAQLLVSAGIAGICFLPEMNPEVLRTLVRTLATTKPPELLTEFKKQFAQKAPVRLLEFRIGGEEPVHAGINLTGALASAMLSNLKGTVASANGEPSRPTSTNDLLRLLCSFDPKEDGGGEGAPENSEETAPTALAEDDVTETIRWLARLSAGQNGTKDVSLPQAQELPAAGLHALRRALEEEVDHEVESDRPSLLSLAEQLAVKVALDRYQRGEIPFNAVQEMLQRLKKEIETLHKVLRSHEDTMHRAGLNVESESETLDRQFWAGIPARNKLQVLLSSEAWCIPPKNILSFVNELADKSDPAAEQILRNYCALLNSGDANARLKIAHGIALLAPASTRVSVRLTRWAMTYVSNALGENLSSEMTPALCTALAALVHEAANARRYEIVPAFFDKLADLQGLAPQISERVHIEAGIEGCAGRFLDDALAAEIPPTDLIEALQQMPYAVASELKRRATTCSKRDEYRKLTDLTDHLGAPLLEALRQSATADQPSEALPALGLLTPLDANYVERTLRKRLPAWSPLQQSVAIHQISCSGMAERGVLLTQLLDSFDELILPQAIDEIGMSGTSKVERLVQEAGRTETTAPYVQLKVIEALGNLKAKVAVALLQEIILARSVWKYEFARETRIVALQALLKIDPATAKNVMKSSGISMEELQLSQLKPSSGSWIRQRKYLRVPIEGEVSASIKSTTGSCDVSVEALSLGGGGGTTSVKSQLATDGEVELKIGLRKVRARVLLHAVDSYNVGFEIASIPLEDRTRLRQFLTARRHR